MNGANINYQTTHSISIADLLRVDEDGHGMHTWDFWNEYLPRGLEWALKN